MGEEFFILHQMSYRVSGWGATSHIDVCSSCVTMMPSPTQMEKLRAKARGAKAARGEQSEAEVHAVTEQASGLCQVREAVSLPYAQQYSGGSVPVFWCRINKTKNSVRFLQNLSCLLIYEIRREK